MSDQSPSWLCTVCGYVHQGPEAADCCPICGATGELFVPHTKTPRPAASAGGPWRCLICEYLHDGQAPPETCPVCGAPAERFETFQNVSAATAADNPGQALDIVIIGAGISGVSAAEAIRNHSAAARITLISKESALPYYRLNLTRYLAGEIDSEQLPIHPESWYRDNAITLLRGKELQFIDTTRKRLTFCDSERLDYDKLVLAMGSHPFVPPFPGVNRENVTVLRTRDDADYILRQCRRDLPCVVIGGGLLGVETAGALARQQVEVTLVEGYGWLMPQQLNRTAGEMLTQQAQKRGIKVRHEAAVRELAGDERVRGVTLESGETIPAGLVIITAGVRTNSYIARLAELETNNGVVVNNLLETSRHDVYAVGDLAEHRGITYGIWGPSQFQGTIAGINAAGGHAEFAGIPRSNALKVLGCDLYSIGQVRPDDGSYRTLEGHLEQDYYCFVFQDGYLVGAILFGNTGLSARVKQLIENREQCSDLLDGAADLARLVQALESSVA